MIKLIKAKQLEEICSTRAYILLRHSDGSQIAANCKSIDICKRYKYYGPNANTKFISFRDCSFNEYISKKLVFIES